MNEPLKILSVDFNLEKSRTIFWIITLLSGGIFWLADHPPMIDMPQHAGQVSLLLDFIKEIPNRTDYFYINIFTPYLLGYGLWTTLALVTSITTALKILLTASFYGFVISSVVLRRQCGADQRLDWLILPAFFGFSFKWGFFTFLLSAPFGIFFIALAMHYSKKPSQSQGIIIFISGLILFFSHGLVFMMSMIIGALLALQKTRNPKILIFLLLPYLSLTPIVAAYFLSAKADITTTQFEYGQAIKWIISPHRIAQFAIYPWGNEYNNKLQNTLSIIALLSPLIIGCKINKNPQASIPFGAIVLIWLIVPHFAMKTFFLYERFSLFIYPFYTLLFTSKPEFDRTILGSTSKIKIQIKSSLLPIITSSALLVNAMQFIAFNKESHSFDQIIGKAPDGAKILALIIDRQSYAARNPSLYIHYASWYQAENNGIVDFNFAWFPPQPVRYRPEKLPKIKPGFEWNPKSFNWQDHDGNNYDYFIIRSINFSAAILLNNDYCKVIHIKSSGPWHIFKKTECAKFINME